MVRGGGRGEGGGGVKWAHHRPQFVNEMTTVTSYRREIRTFSFSSNC